MDCLGWISQTNNLQRFIQVCQLLINLQRSLGKRKGGICKLIPGLVSQCQTKFGIAKESRDPAPGKDLGCRAPTALLRDGSTPGALPWFPKPGHQLSYAEVARCVLAACELAVSQGTTVCQAVRSEWCSSQGLQSVLRIWFQGPAGWSQRPSPTRLTPHYLQTSASLVRFSLESPPPGYALGMNSPAWADLKRRAMTGLSAIGSFSSSLPKTHAALGMVPIMTAQQQIQETPTASRPLSIPKPTSGVPRTGTPLSTSAPPHHCPQTSAQH